MKAILAGSRSHARGCDESDRVHRGHGRIPDRGARAVLPVKPSAPMPRPAPCVAVAALCPKARAWKSKPSPSCKCFVSAFTSKRFSSLFSLTLGPPRVLRMGRSGLLLPERLSGQKREGKAACPCTPTRERIGASARDKKPRTGQGFYSVGKWARRWERAVLGFCSASQIWASRSAESA